MLETSRWCDRSIRAVRHSVGPSGTPETAALFGTPVAETILASGHGRPHQQAGHMIASDPIRSLPQLLQAGGRPHMGPGSSLAPPTSVSRFAHHCMRSLVRDTDHPSCRHATSRSPSSTASSRAIHRPTPAPEWCDTPGRRASRRGLAVASPGLLRFANRGHCVCPSNVRFIGGLPK